MTELIQHKIIRCNDSPYMRKCMTCRVEFTAGEDRHEWRMFILYKPRTWDEDDDYDYSKCGYWVTNCHECFVMNMVSMKDDVIEHLESMPDRIRELA